MICPMEPIQTQEEIENNIKEHDLVVLYFTGSACSACEVIKQKVIEMLKKYPEIKAIQVNGEENIEVARAYEVYSLPLMILFVQGKESIREGRHLDLLDFERKLVRYSALLQ